jgi:hypothetical protein
MATATKAAPAARTHPAKHLPELTGSGVLRWMRTVGRHEIEGSDATREVAQLLYRAVMRSGKLPGGVDRILAARRLRKAVLHAAVAQEEAARAFSAAQSVYLAQFGEPSRRVADRGFDPTR